MKSVRAHKEHFKAEASRARDGVALIFDIGGFSQFFNQPDVHMYIPKYLNHVIRCVEMGFWGGKMSWNPEGYQDAGQLDFLPVHRKFLGDGALYIWAPKKEVHITKDFVFGLMNSVWNLQKNFAKVNEACSDLIPVAELPNSIRFGIARGTVYELTVEESQEREYIGICINLASRLQKYCTGMNFMASARMNMAESELTKYKYMKVVATQVKGFPKEIVIVDQKEYEGLEDEIKKKLFAPIKKSNEAER